MPRKRINSEGILTNAEKQRRYREKKKAQGLKRIWSDTGVIFAPDATAIRESVKEELKAAWEPDVKKARIDAARKQGRETEKRKDKTRAQGRAAGICEAAAFFIGKDRTDIAQVLLSHFCIDRETAVAALEADKRTKSITLKSLDQSGAWGKPPKVIK